MPRSERESMIIIGAGLGGLSTGCYARMNGYRTHVLEMHELPGGCCTAWDRGDFRLDPCVSWLLGSGPGNEMHQIWLELGALQGRRSGTSTCSTSYAAGAAGPCTSTPTPTASRPT